ncbi:gibberellin-regulated protein 12-like isoform X1 [Macadamia integrifolia]|uniref:gibberellin-regulated protein 12-like isoform X1 n=1 Tax=Macadamia integrifolia TaxID=60698 RepID=UPI001C4F04AC|nr:gibberellin-regulated protein 12-like isoform X1 [Macadamia integrifolia]
MACFFGLPTAFVLLLAFVLVVQVSSVQLTTNSDATYQPMGGEGSLRPEDCAKACAYRCSATAHKNNCLLFCNMCCKKCLCVPSGTYGHKEECPCYNNWKTQEGGPKCP